MFANIKLNMCYFRDHHELFSRPSSFSLGGRGEVRSFEASLKKSGWGRGNIFLKTPEKFTKKVSCRAGGFSGCGNSSRSSRICEILVRTPRGVRTFRATNSSRSSRILSEHDYSTSNSSRSSHILNFERCELLEEFPYPELYPGINATCPTVAIATS